MFSNNLRHILYIEDDIGLGRLLQKRLAGKNLEIDIAETGEAGLEAIRRKKYDLILLDNFLPDMNGIDLLDHLQPLENQPPIILLTASGDERLAVQALEKGAADYAVKDVEQFYIDLLPAVMGAAFTRYRLMAENRQQRQDLEKATQKAQAANQAKSEFLTTMSHEIRTPLNVILGVAGLLERNITDEKQREMIGVLHTNATVLLGLVNDILDLSRVESGKVALEMTNFKAKQLLAEINAMFHLEATKKKLEIRIEDTTGNIEWRGDLLRVQQIIMNLVSNSIKFTEKGHILAKATITANHALQITIEDTGIGISKNKLDAIFSKFVQADQSITRRFGGSGLGLALSQSFAKLMHGLITVESQEGKGSIFTVTLPLQYCYETDQDVEESAPAHERQSVTEGETRNILLVEDYPANVMIATMMLEELHYTIIPASNGQEAVDQVRKADKPFYAILMDIQMQGMDGFEATRQIRQIEKERDIRNHIIGATAHALTGDKERCLNAGMDDYISKPIDWDLMADKLSKINTGA
jgi:signal transduction histidine kinase